MAQMTQEEWIAAAHEAVEQAVEKQPARVTIYKNGTGKQETRLRKALCPGCGYTVRVTSKWIDRGLPVCSTCVVEFVLEEKDDDEEAGE